MASLRQPMLWQFLVLAAAGLTVLVVPTGNLAAQPTTGQEPEVFELLDQADTAAHGFGTRPNWSQAAQLYRQAAELGDPVARARFAVVQFRGWYVPLDREAARGTVASVRPQVEQRAAAGDRQALQVLGEICRFGIGQDVEGARAVELLERAHRAGQRTSALYLAAAELYGLNGDKNAESARRWLTLAMEAGDLAAYSDLGTYLVGGGSVLEKNGAEGMTLLRKAAEAGHPHAMGWLAGYLMDGTGTERDPSAGVEWARRGIESGSFLAMGALGFAYSRGIGIDQDLGAAFELYRRAAQHPHYMAMSRLGWAYLQGKGTAQNTAEGIRWLERAAEGGYAHAALSLAQLYDYGLWGDVERDEAVALRWYERAADLGDREAKGRLRYSELLERE